MKTVSLALFLFLISNIQTFGAIKECHRPFIKPSLYYKQTVLTYYLDIDQGHLSEVFKIFANRAIYERGESFYLGSKSKIKKFYTEVRSLKGKHSINKISVSKNSVFVEGSFTGKHEEREIQTNFTDFWLFNTDGLIVYRKSTIDQEGI
ncbi:MAG: hypothetical protein H6621_07945 [Halobacteriovoraceae bacterium]|nr:hypothetical protein [Halobacteriovoraceae bacterium]